VTARRTHPWRGPAWVAWRTRNARRAGDVGDVVRSIARGADTAVGIRVGRQRILLPLDPALVGRLLVEHAAETTKGPGVQLTRQMLGNGLLTSEGAPHDRARKLIAPAFSPRRLADYTDAFGDRTQARTSGWHDAEILDIHDEMAALTLDIVGRTLLGIDLADRAPAIRGSLESALERFGEVGGGSLLNRTPGRRFALVGHAAHRRRSAVREPRPAEAEVHAVVDEVIGQRREHPCDDGRDLVSALLSDGQVRAGMSDQDIHDHVITLIMAGHETSANALTWALFLLGRHPRVQEQLHIEVDRLPPGGPTFARLPELPFTRAVIAEAMRLYPPAWLLGRTLLAPLQFAGWHAPAGTLVAVSPMLLHRDPRWFADPDNFDPDRWLDDRRLAVPRYAFLPFGTGPRACIGEQFAWAEAVTVLAVIASRWDVHTSPELNQTPHYRVTLRPSGAVPLRVSARRRPDDPIRCPG